MKTDRRAGTVAKKGKGASTGRKHGKRLEQDVSCPGCRTVVNPFILEYVTGRRHEGSHGFSIPDRHFLECPSCGSEFYKPVAEGKR